MWWDGADDHQVLELADTSDVGFVGHQVDGLCGHHGLNVVDCVAGVHGFSLGTVGFGEFDAEHGGLVLSVVGKVCGLFVGNGLGLV